MIEAIVTLSISVVSALVIGSYYFGRICLDIEKINQCLTKVESRIHDVENTLIEIIKKG